MRIAERIDPVLRNIDWEKFITYLGVYESRPVIRATAKLIRKDIDRIRAAWEANPDLRLTQILCITNHILNTPGVWYYLEETDFLIREQGVALREVLFWGKNYTQEGRRLPKTQYTLIKDMETEHIQAILQASRDKALVLSPAYQQLFKNELTFRKSLAKIESKRNRGNSKRAVAAKSRPTNKARRSRKNKSKTSRSIRVTKSR